MSRGRYLPLEPKRKCQDEPSLAALFVFVAQMEERRHPKPEVVGSTPTGDANPPMVVATAIFHTDVESVRFWPAGPSESSDARVAQLVVAPLLQRGGRRFEPVLVYQAQVVEW